MKRPRAVPFFCDGALVTPAELHQLRRADLLSVRKIRAFLRQKDAAKRRALGGTIPTPIPTPTEKPHHD